MRSFGALLDQLCAANLGHLSPEARLATALVRAFAAERVDVLWARWDERGQLTESARAAVADTNGTELQARRIDLGVVSSIVTEPNRLYDLAACLGVPIAVGIRVRRGECTELLLTVGQPSEDAEFNTVALWGTDYIRGWRRVALTHSSDRSERRMERRLEALTWLRESKSMEAWKQISDVARDQPTETRNFLIDYVTRAVHNRVFGTGRHDRAVEVGESPDRKGLVEVLSSLDAASPHLSSPHRRSLDRALGKRADLFSGDGDDLLDAWVALHAEAEARASQPRGRAQTGPWPVGVDAVDRLELWLRGPPPEAFDRLCGWLHVRMAAAGLRIAAAQDSSWSIRADLAYVVREGLRRECHFSWLARRVSAGAIRTSDLSFRYIFQPAPYAEALRAAIGYHAVEVLGLPPALDIPGFLAEVGNSDGAEGYLRASGHLHHVLSAYAFVDWLLVGRAFAQHLASPGVAEPAQDAVLKLRQTCALAVLFHDTGVLLFPRFSAPGAQVSRGDQQLAAAEQSIDEALSKAGKTLADTARGEVEFALSVPADTQLKAWIDEQYVGGQPHHALLSGWYLSRLAASVANGLRPDVRRLAIRAVLLHGAPSQVIDVATDAAAALLAICDEIFDWDPDARRPPERTQSADGAAGLAVDLRPHVPRLARLIVGESGEFQGWLREPQLLEEPLLRIWISTSQNFQRIAPLAGFVPRIELRSLPASGLGRLESTCELLEKTVEQTTIPSRGALLEWMRRVRPSVSRDRSEGVTATAIGKPMHTRDIREDLPRFLADAALVTAIAQPPRRVERAGSLRFVSKRRGG